MVDDTVGGKDIMEKETRKVNDKKDVWHAVAIVVDMQVFLYFQHVWQH